MCGKRYCFLGVIHPWIECDTHMCFFLFLSLFWLLLCWESSCAMSPSSSPCSVAVETWRREDNAAEKREGNVVVSYNLVVWNEAWISGSSSCAKRVCVLIFFYFWRSKIKQTFGGAVYNISETKDVMWEKSPLNFVTRKEEEEKVLNYSAKGEEEEEKRKKERKGTFTLLVRTANWRALKMGEINNFFPKKDRSTVYVVGPLPK